MVEPVSLGGIWASFAKLDAKDVTTLGVSLVALVTSVTGVLHSITSNKRDRERSARSEFATIVEGLVDVRQTRESLRRELGDDWGKRQNTETRLNLNDKEELLLSRARFLLIKYHINASDVQYVIVGLSLSDSGRHGESLQYYKKAVDVAPSKLAAAWCRRAYGRTLIVAGNVERGRSEMLSAAAEFERLKAEVGIDAEAMRNDRALVFLRSVWAQIQFGEYTHVQEDYKKLTELVAELQDPMGRNELRDAIDELDEALRDRGLLEAPRTGTEPMAMAVAVARDDGLLRKQL